MRKVVVWSLRIAAFLLVSTAALSWRFLLHLPYRERIVLAWRSSLEHLLKATEGPVDWVDVIVGTFILAIIPFILAAYGGHVAAETLPDPRVRRGTKLKFWGLCFVGVMLAFYQQYRSSRSDQDREKRTDLVQKLILSQLQNFHSQAPPVTTSVPATGTAPKPTEAARRRNILATLRNEYIMSHAAVSPALLAGTEQPPTTWVNTRLQQLGEHWMVSSQHPLAVSSVEVLPYSVGKKITARIHLSNTEAPAKVRISYYRGFARNFDEQYDARKMLEDSLWGRVEEQAKTNPNTMDVPVIADTYSVIESEAELTEDQLKELKMDRTFYVMAIIVTDDGSSRIERCFHTVRDVRQNANDPIMLNLCIEHND
jgi:hypothetical protein